MSDETVETGAEPEVAKDLVKETAKRNPVVDKIVSEEKPDEGTIARAVVDHRDKLAEMDKVRGF